MAEEKKEKTLPEKITDLAKTIKMNNDAMHKIKNVQTGYVAVEDPTGNIKNAMQRFDFLLADLASFDQHLRVEQNRLHQEAGEKPE